DAQPLARAPARESDRVDPGRGLHDGLRRSLVSDTLESDRERSRPPRRQTLLLALRSDGDRGGGGLQDLRPSAGARELVRLQVGEQTTARVVDEVEDALEAAGEERIGDVKLAARPVGKQQVDARPAGADPAELREVLPVDGEDAVELLEVGG